MCFKLSRFLQKCILITCMCTMMDLKVIKSHELALLFNHMPKTGGSTCKRLLATVVGEPMNLRQYQQRLHDGSLPERFHIVEAEFFELSPMQEYNVFTVGGVRSPCDYYLSLWSFGSDNKGGLHGQLQKQFKKKAEMYYGHTPPYDNPTDLDHLTNFLQLEGGVMSKRLIQSYGSPRYWKNGFSHRNVDCWVHTEFLFDDMRHCLQQFEIAGGFVDWQEFERQVVLGAKNPSQHTSCKRYFNEERRSIIYNTEQLVFDQFNYTSCCNGGD